jgi:monothiol glutaredoxin
MDSSNPFHIAGGSPESNLAGKPVGEVDRTSSALERVEKMVTSSAVFLFMKGVPEQPLCGFSSSSVAILETIGVPYSTFDVLSDESIREAAKQFAEWPTFPQLWVHGEFVGGNDIMTEMLQTGELEGLVKGAPA